MPAPEASRSTSGVDTTTFSRDSLLFHGELAAKRGHKVRSQPAQDAGWQPKLDEGVAVKPFAPGRYVTDVHKSVRGTHARNWYRENGRATFVLELAAGGAAKGCRGKRWATHHTGPRVNDHSRGREQQGYRGKWRLHGEGVRVDLQPNNEVCGQERLYTNLEPSPWILDCVWVQPQKHLVLPAPALACQLVDGARFKWKEDGYYFVRTVFPGEWMILGPGDGLRVVWDSKKVGYDPKPAIDVKLSPTPIQHGTWASE